jgi:hypothetical protein
MNDLVWNPEFLAWRWAIKQREPPRFLNVFGA